MCVVCGEYIYSRPRTNKCFLSRGWEMKVISNRCLWKLAMQNGGIWNPMICWWPKTSGEKKKPGKLSRSCSQHMDGIPFISQQQALKSNEESSLQSSCQPWRKLDVQCIVLLYVLAHMGLWKKQNQTKLFVALSWATVARTRTARTAWLTSTASWWTFGTHSSDHWCTGGEYKTQFLGTSHFD